MNFGPAQVGSIHLGLTTGASSTKVRLRRIGIRGTGSSGCLGAAGHPRIQSVVSYSANLRQTRNIRGYLLLQPCRGPADDIATSVEPRHSDQRGLKPVET